jgi:hypothetical protein
MFTVRGESTIEFISLLNSPVRASDVPVPSNDSRTAHNMAATFSWRNLPHSFPLSFYTLPLITQIGLKIRQIFE